MGLFNFKVKPEPGKIAVRVIADSVNPDGDRLTTLEAVFNRWILAELNTHRVLSRNSASSRAIPIKKILRQVWSDPAMPVSWGANQAGMQARSELSGWRLRLARRLFLLARIPALVIAWLLSKVGLHKQVTNRILEPWAWHTAIVSGTEFDNFFTLRLHPDAQPEFQELARCAKAAMEASVPAKLNWGEWHLPYTDEMDDVARVMVPFEHDSAIPIRAWVSCARCARVSYVRQNEKRDAAADIEMTIKLKTEGHWSPFEHPAQAIKGLTQNSNFRGWQQLRKFYPGEDGRISRIKEPVCTCDIEPEMYCLRHG